jgi:hypothetical protein
MSLAWSCCPHPAGQKKANRRPLTSPGAGLPPFVTDLMGAGLSKDQITTMGREVTSKLLMG